MSACGAANRERSLERLRTGVFDVLVIGAGIVGARIAFEAAHASATLARERLWLAQAQHRVRLRKPEKPAV